MKYFLDSAKIEEIKEAYHTFGIDGVTTNPRHIMVRDVYKRQGPDMRVDDEISYEWMRIPHFYTPYYVCLLYTSRCV